MPFPAARFLIAAACAVAGASTMALILLAMGGVEREAVQMVPAAALGAGLSGLAFAGLFGRPGRGLLAVLGAFLATGLGSFLGGAVWGLVQGLTSDFSDPLLLVVLQSGGFAFLVVMLMVPVEHPVVVLGWGLLMGAVQLAAFLVRQGLERA